RESQALRLGGGELELHGGDDLPVEVAEEVGEEDDGEGVAEIALRHGRRVSQNGNAVTTFWTGRRRKTLPVRDPAQLLLRDHVELPNLHAEARRAVGVQPHDLS